MAGMLPGNDPGGSEASSVSNDLHQDEVTTWYFSRREIEKDSPSRRDGISLKKETFLRKSYCTFLKDLGDRLRVPQTTIATAIVFCHRFFIRHSHAQNNRWTIATVCMFLAGKVVNIPLDLKDIIISSNQILQKKELDVAQTEEIYEQQKELVLSTLKSDLNVRHPYKPLADAIAKYFVDKFGGKFYKVAKSFVDDCLGTSLCLQYKPQQIAAYAFFHAAKHFELNLEQEDRDYYKEFDITFSQLNDIEDQMLELDVWYFSREEIEDSPSKLDGIDLKKENFLRESYCTFLKNLGARLRVNLTTVATAIVLCHRFFIRQSHAKNDSLTIATACMSLAAKVEYSQRFIKDVIVFSNEIIQKRTLDADQRQEVYEQQKERVLSAEELVLSTLNFDLTVHHPYDPLANAIVKYKVQEANDEFPEVALGFVNECLQTTFCLQYKPHQIAGFSFILAFARLEMDPQLEAFCKEFDLTRSVLQDMNDQMRELRKNESDESGTQNPDDHPVQEGIEK